MGYTTEHYLGLSKPVTKEQKTEYYKQRAKRGIPKTGPKPKEPESCYWSACGCPICSERLGYSIYPTWYQFGEFDCRRKLRQQK